MTMIPTRDQTPRLAGPAAHPPRPSPGGGSGLTSKDIWRIIRKRKWLIILTFVICTGTMATVTFLWWRYAPGYTATAELEVSTPLVTMMRAAATEAGKDVIERYQRTYAARVKSHVVLTNAAGDEGLKGTTWFKKHKGDVVQELYEEINVSPQPGTNSILVSMTGTNREELADIVNAVVREFVKFTRRNAGREREDTIKKLRSVRDTLRGNIRGILQQIADAKRTHSIAAMQERRGVVTIRLQYLTRQVGEAEVADTQARAALGAYEKQKEGNTLVQDPMVLQALDFDYALRTLKVRLTELKTSLYNAIQRFGPKHRSIQDIEGLIEAVKKQITDREKEVIETQLLAIGQMRQTAVILTTDQLVDLKNRFNRVEDEAKDLEAALGRIEALRQEAADIQVNLSLINSRLMDLSVLDRPVRPGAEEAEVGPVSIGAHAAEPRKAQWSQPKWSVMMPLGAVVGLLLGFGLAFLLEFGDTSVRSPTDLARRVDLPLLGMVPHADDLDEEIEDFRRVVLTAPHSPAAEAFRQIRTNLLFSGPAQQRRSLLVTSPAPQDGRTTVVTNLAVSMAQAGRRVLVVDVNFRQPAIAEMFPQAPQAGLSSALVGQAAWRDAVLSTEVPNLSVIAAGPLPPNPAELLGSDTMRQLISEMTAEYDQVIFDGSPTMVVTDARVLSTQVDGVILVVRAGANSAGIVQRSTEQLVRVGARVLGVVLQAVRTTAGGYLRKNYETFYEYHQRALP